MKKALIALLGVYAVAGCGGVDVENQNPIVTGFIDPVTLFVSERATLTVSEYFSDPDGDVLSYTVSTPDPNDLDTDLVGDSLTIQGLGPVMTTVTIVAADIYDAQAEISFDVIVIDAIRDDFDTDLGWIGLKGFHNPTDLVQIQDGQLTLSVSADYIVHAAVREIDTLGPDWYYSARLNDTPQVCGGILAIPIPFREGQVPQFAWSIDLDPFGGWFVAVYVAHFDDWIILAQGFLPSGIDADEEWEEIGIGLTADGIFYGFANGDFKLFEYDVNFVIDDFEIPKTITQLGIGGQPCESSGGVFVDWVEASIRAEEGIR